MTTEFESLGFLVATTDTAAQTPRHLVEVYPHPALLALLNREVRVPYKVAKSTRYWRGTALRQRIELLLTEFTAIFEGLQQAIGRIPLTIPRHSNVSRITHLKRFEDALDAIVSAWVGTVYAAGDAVPLGDARAAIWCPSAAIRSKDQVQ